MDKHFIVSRFQPDRLDELSNRSVVFKIDDSSQINEIQKKCSEYNIHIHCVIYETAKNLSDINFSEEWIKIPMAFQSNSIGKLSILLKRAYILKKLNIRYYFSTLSENCYRDIRILASLGYPCTLRIEGQSADWEEITDLMTYSLLNVVQHAEIYPFNYVEYYYESQIRTDFSAVYFEDPERYLHLTLANKLKLSPDDLDEDASPTFDPDDYNTIRKMKEYIDFIYKWQDFFIEPMECSCCKGWRICLGKYAQNIESNPGCSEFFGEFLDILDIQRENGKRQEPDHRIWQP